MTTYNKPLPQITPRNRPYWAAAKERQLKLQKCGDCGQVIYPISVQCHNCWSENLGWVQLSGRGKLDTWAIYHQAFHEGFVDDVPYNVAQVELEEGPRLITNIVGCKNEDLYHGMPLEVCFDDVTPEVTLVKFKPTTKEKMAKRHRHKG